jgi:tetratricopeptide (TPR) repeat protein
MYRADVVASLIIEYLESVLPPPDPWRERYLEVVSTLKQIWDIEDASDHPGFPPLASLLFALPDEEGLYQIRAQSARVAVGCGDFDRSISAIGDLLPLGYEGPAKLLVERSGALLKKGQFADVVADCESVIEIDPQNQACHLRLAHALLAMKRDDEARAAFRRALDCCPNDDAVRDFAAVMGVGAL